LCLENTWNGHPMPADYLAQATALARQHGLAAHLDGARLFNAAAALAQAELSVQDELSGELVALAARRIASHFDSVSVCFSKGLGAPVGSALCGSKALIARAWRRACMALTVCKFARLKPISCLSMWPMAGAPTCWLS
jgi:threonine aldolase